MNNELSQAQPPDPRISSLRVRIMRMKDHDFSEHKSVFEELFLLGHAAESLMPEIIQRVKTLGLHPQLQELICNLKSDILLKAAQKAEVWFHDSEIFKFLKAGFQEFELPLLDKVWEAHNCEITINSSTVQALGTYARRPETLDTLLVIQENCYSKI